VGRQNVRGGAIFPLPLSHCTSDIDADVCCVVCLQYEAVTLDHWVSSSLGTGGLRAPVSGSATDTGNHVTAWAMMSSSGLGWEAGREGEGRPRRYGVTDHRQAWSSDAQRRQRSGTTASRRGIP